MGLLRVVGLYDTLHGPLARNAGNGYASSRTITDHVQLSVTLLSQALSLALCNLIRAPDKLENEMFNNAVLPAENEVMKIEYCPLP
jgi:hypothetical protein